MSVEKTVKANLREAKANVNRKFGEYLKGDAAQHEVLNAMEKYENAQSKVDKFNALVKEMESL